MAGYNVGIGVDTKAAKQGIELGLIEPLEDAVDALDALGKSRGPEQLERDLRDAQKATERLKDDTKDTARAIEQEYRDAYRKLKQSADDGYGKARQAADGFKDEAKQNFAEVASSFDGSMSGLADGVQGTLGGLATAIPGGVGLALAGLGAVAGAVGNEWANTSEQIQEDWKAMYEDMAASGNAFLSEDLVQQKIRDLYADQGKRNEIQAEANKLGLDAATVARAQAGDMEALTQVHSRATEIFNAEFEATEKANRERQGTPELMSKEGAEAERLQDKYGGLLRAQDDAAKAAAGARKAIGEVGSTASGAGDSVAGLKAKLEALPANVRSRLSLDTSEAEESMRRITSAVNALDGRSVAIRIEGQTGPGRHIL